MVMGKKVRVKSSAIEYVQYSKDRKTATLGTLVVYFTNNDVRKYADVPESVHEELITHQSVGYYFNTFVRDRYAQMPV